MTEQKLNNKTDRICFELIRHGQTEGNLLKRYIGRTDEDLCKEGILSAARLYAVTEPADIWLISPMRRCLETACLAAGVPSAVIETLIREHADDGVFLQHLAQQCPDSMIRIADDLRECDFGSFENKNWQELDGDSAYQSWIDSNGSACFPGGERPEAFRQRCAETFEQQVRSIVQTHMHEEKPLSVRLIVHGGTIMSIMDAFALPTNSARTYYDWHVENGEIIRACWDGRWPLTLSAEEDE